MSKEKPFVVSSGSEGRRTSPDKKRELHREKEGSRFCSLSASLDRWMLKHACDSFRVEGGLWTQLHRRQRGDEFCWRAQAIRDMRRLAGKHTFRSLGGNHCFTMFLGVCLVVALTGLFQNLILQIAGPVSVVVEDGPLAVSYTFCLVPCINSAAVEAVAPAM